MASNDPLSAPSPSTPVLHPANIAGAPFVTIGGGLIGAGQYLATQGVAVPHDWQGWAQLILGVLIAVVGALARGPQA